VFTRTVTSGAPRSVDDAATVHHDGFVLVLVLGQRPANPNVADSPSEKGPEGSMVKSAGRGANSWWF